jgi:hypothetical protein
VLLVRHAVGLVRRFGRVLLRKADHT